MGISSVFTHCVLNYAISMNNSPCSKWVGIWAWFTIRRYWRRFEGTLQSWTNLMHYNCFIPNCNYSLRNTPNLHNKLLQNPLRPRCIRHIILYSLSIRTNLWVSLVVGLQLPAFFVFLVFIGRKSCCLSRTWQIKKNRQSFVRTACLKVRFQSFPKVWSSICVRVVTVFKNVIFCIKRFL